MYENFTQWDDTPQGGMTTFLFSSAKAQHPSTVVRLLNFGEASGGGGERLARIGMEPLAVVSSSSLSFTFAHFDGSLLFDPGACPLVWWSGVEHTSLTGNWRGFEDFGLLVGIERDHDGRGGGSTSANLGLILGAAIAIPLALGLIVVFIALVSAWLVLQRRAALANSRGAVSLDDPSTSDDQL